MDYVLLDQLVAAYYVSLGMTNYFADQLEGRLLSYIRSNNLINLSIDNQLEDNAEPMNCLLTTFDDDFPIQLDIQISNDMDQKYVIFYVLQHCYKFNHFPPADYIKTKMQHRTQQYLSFNTSNTYDIDYYEQISRMKIAFQRYNTHTFDKTQLTELLNDYFHLYKYHAYDSHHHEFICNIFEHCNITNCELFQRHYSQSNDCDYRQQIVDKIHCVYQHCYDVGFRLRNSEKKKIEGLPLHVKAKKTMNILSNNHKQLRCLDYIDRKNKFFSTSNNTDTNMYDYGYMFQYEANESINDSIRYNNNFIGLISHKYKTLKEELTLNNLCTISTKEFYSELKKAEIHYATSYCKECYHDIKLCHLLCVMFYCNFYKLQYEFSKTYRKSKKDTSKKCVKNRHRNYYWWGKYLKECVHIFGTEISHGKVKSFYHGIDKELQLPFCTWHYILCPLSTSSSFEVSAMFAQNAGIIVEFTGSNCKYFSVSWLSDYGNESEMLFIQNKFGLKCNNIILTKISTESKPLIEAIYTLDNMNVQPNDMMKSLISKVVENKLNFIGCDYLKNLIYQYLGNKVLLHLDWNQLKRKTFFFALFCHSEYEWIKINIINELYPNLQEIWVDNVNLSSLVFDNIIWHLSNNTSKLHDIWIRMPETCTFSIQSVVLDYEHRLKRLHFNIEHVKKYCVWIHAAH
eukprot:486840_1